MKIKTKRRITKPLNQIQTLPRLLAVAACAGLALGAGLSGAAAQQVIQPDAAPAPQQEPGSPAQQQIMQELMQIGQQLEQVERKIQATQQQAMQDPQVQAEQKKFEKALNSAITQASPDAEAMITHRKELIEEIEGNPELQQGRQPGPELQGQIQRFQQIEQQLAPLRQQASATPEVRQTQEGFEQTLVKEMQKVEPKITDLFQEHSQLAQRFRQLQTQAQQLEQQE